MKDITENNKNTLPILIGAAVLLLLLGGFGMGGYGMGFGFLFIILKERYAKII